MIIVLCVIVYLLSAFLMWLHTHLAYSEKGRWSGLVVDGAEVWVVFISVINSFLSLFLWTGWWPIYGRDRLKQYEKFFRIK